MESRLIFFPTGTEMFHFPVLVHKLKQVLRFSATKTKLYIIAKRKLLFFSPQGFAIVIPRLL